MGILPLSQEPCLPPRNFVVIESKEIIPIRHFSLEKILRSLEGIELCLFPPPLQYLSIFLSSRLKGFAPTSLSNKYSNGLGLQEYLVNKDFNYLLTQSQLPPSSPFWKQIWNKDGLPKINILCWTLSHRKILTGEIFLKRGFHGPTRCILCKNSLEATSHIFLECSFSHSLWQEALQTLYPWVIWPSYII